MTKTLELFREVILIYKITDQFRILNFGHCNLPFDLTQGGELVEPFDICDLYFVISNLYTAENHQTSYI